MAPEIERKHGRTIYEVVNGTSVVVTDPDSRFSLTLSQLPIFRLVYERARRREIARRLRVTEDLVNALIHNATERNYEFLDGLEGRQGVFYLAFQAQIRGWLEEEFINEMGEYFAAEKWRLAETRKTAARPRRER